MLANDTPVASSTVTALTDTVNGGDDFGFRASMAGLFKTSITNRDATSAKVESNND